MYVYETCHIVMQEHTNPGHLVTQGGWIVYSGA